MYRQDVPKEVAKVRHSTHKIHPLFLGRWSPRSMTGEALPKEELLSLFEAARWAPSSYNEQPWRFLFARRDTPEWELFYNLLVPFNQEWTRNAAALVVILSKKNFEKNGKPSKTHSFDTGAAWMSLALEGNARGLVTHGMEGFDYDKARRDLEIPENYQIEAMAAIGKPAPKEHLSEELQKREVPSLRRPLDEIIMEGKFRGSNNPQK